MRLWPADSEMEKKESTYVLLYIYFLFCLVGWSNNYTWKITHLSVKNMKITSKMANIVGQNFQL